MTVLQMALMLLIFHLALRLPVEPARESEPARDI